MANTSAAIKDIRKNGRRRLRNRLVRSASRTHIKHALSAIEEGDAAQSKAAVEQALSALDKAAQKGMIHKNNAARRKARLVKRLKAASEKPA